MQVVGKSLQFLLFCSVILTSNFLLRTNCFTSKKCALNWHQVNHTYAVTKCGGDYDPNHLDKRDQINSM